MHRLADLGAIDRKAALARLFAGPPVATWRRVADVAGAMGGAALLGAAVIYVVAFNWDELGRFAQFAVVASMVGGAGILAAWGFHSVAGKASLLLAFLSTGALMALFGQTYQTGVDPWQLFAGWSALTIAWAVAADMPALWALQAGLWNVALSLWWTQSGGARLEGRFEGWHALVVLDGLLWGGSLLAGWLYRPVASGWLPRVLLVASLATATGLTMLEPWSRGAGDEATLVLWVVLLAASLVRGRWDPATWALAGMSLVACTGSAVSKWVVDGGRVDNDPLEFAARLLVVGLVVAAESVALAMALRWGTRQFGASE